MKIYPILVLLAAAGSANATEITLDFEEYAQAACSEPSVCDIVADPFNFAAVRADTLAISETDEPGNQALMLDDEAVAIVSMTANSPSIASFAVKSFDVYLPSIYNWPIHQQLLEIYKDGHERETIDGIPMNEWYSVTVEDPLFTDLFRFAVRDRPQGNIARAYIDNLVVDFEWGNFDIAAIADLSADALADFTLLPLWGKPTVFGIASSDATTAISDVYATSSWQPAAHDVVTDGNGDGVADDPLMAVLSQSQYSLRVNIHELGESLPARTLYFYRIDNAIDVAVLNDTNGDGVPDDPTIAVLAEKTSTGRQALLLRRLDGTVVGSWTITKENQELIALSAISLPDNNSMISVLTRNTLTGRSFIHSFRATDGVRTSKQNVLGPTHEPRNLAILADGNSNGIADDPFYVVLSEKASNGKQMATLIDALTGDSINESRVLNANWTAHSIAVSPDLSGDGLPDLLTVATRNDNGRLVVNIRELDSGDQVTNLYPVIPNPAKVEGCCAR